AAPLLPLLALVAAPFCVPAQASDYEVGTSLVCDTQGQVERFVALFNGDAQAAIRVVNAEEANPNACAIMNVAYMRGMQVGMARRKCIRDRPHPGCRRRNPRGHPPGTPCRLLLAVRGQGVRGLIRHTSSFGVADAKRRRTRNDHAYVSTLKSLAHNSLSSPGS